MSEELSIKNVNADAVPGWRRAMCWFSLLLLAVVWSWYSHPSLRLVEKGQSLIERDRHVTGRMAMQFVIEKQAFAATVP